MPCPWNLYKETFNWCWITIQEFSLSWSWWETWGEKELAGRHGAGEVAETSISGLADGSKRGRFWAWLEHLKP